MDSGVTRAVPLRMAPCTACRTASRTGPVAGTPNWRARFSSTTSASCVFLSPAPAAALVNATLAPSSAVRPCFSARCALGSRPSVLANVFRASLTAGGCDGAANMVAAFGLVGGLRGGAQGVGCDVVTWWWRPRNTNESQICTEITTATRQTTARNPSFHVEIMRAAPHPARVGTLAAALSARWVGSGCNGTQRRWKSAPLRYQAAGSGVHTHARHT